MVNSTKFIVFKRDYNWCAARRDGFRVPTILYSHPDWDVAIKVAVLSSEGRIREFGEWYADYKRRVITEGEDLLRQMKAS